MGKRGRLGSERPVEQQLRAGTRQEVVAAQDVRDLHSDVVNDHRKLIRPRPICTPHYEVAGCSRVHGNVAQHIVVDIQHLRLYPEAQAGRFTLTLFLHPDLLVQPPLRCTVNRPRAVRGTRHALHIFAGQVALEEVAPSLEGFPALRS